MVLVCVQLVMVLKVCLKFYMTTDLLTLLLW